jgi:hypothetical protein
LTRKIKTHRKKRGRKVKIPTLAKPARMGHPREKNKFKDRTLRTEGCGTPTEKEKAKFPERRG